MKLSVYKLKFAKLWKLIGWVLVLFIFYISVAKFDLSPEIEKHDKNTHLSVYFFLCYYFLMIYREMKTVAVLVILYSILMEIIQFLLPYRGFELADILANIVGTIVACLLFKHLKFNPVKYFDERFSRN